MFERIVIKEINEGCADKMRILFDLKSQSHNRPKGLKENIGIFLNSPKSPRERCKTPSDFSSFYGLKGGNRWKSPGTKLSFRISKKVERLPVCINNRKRNISDELLDGIDSEVRNRHEYRLSRPGRLKLVHNHKRPFVFPLNKISIFDGTVPESIIIESKSPVIKK